MGPEWVNGGPDPLPEESKGGCPTQAQRERGPVCTAPTDQRLWSSLGPPTDPLPIFMTPPISPLSLAQSFQTHIHWLNK